MFILLALLLTLTGQIFAQSKVTVTGHVMDNNGTPLVGASILESGTYNGVSTDTKGNFTIHVSQFDSELHVSFIGYESRSIKANVPEVHQGIILQEVAAMVDEVVVIGYSTVRKSDLTGSVSVVKADDINRGSVLTADEMLKAKVPGLLVVPGDGGPNSGSTIRIRGTASLMASNDPLIVIDGLPISHDAGPGMGNALAAINPSDIESFSVLKDASATAIYGSRASNGVILVTTKKGRGSKPTISYNSSYYIKSNIKNIEVMGADEYREFMLDYYPEDTKKGQDLRALMGDYSTDWQDLVYRNAFGTDHNISVYGNAKNVLPYRLSIGYTKEQATLKTGDFERVTGDLSLSPKFFDDHLSVSLNAKGTYNKNNFADGGAVGAAAFFDPTQAPYFYNQDGSVNYDKANGYFNWYNSDGTIQTQAGNSPMSLLYDQYDRNDAARIVGNVQLDYKMHFLPELRANLNLGLDLTKTMGRKGPKEGSYMALKDGNAPGYGKRNEYKNLYRDQTLEFYLAYANEIERHKFDVMGGYSWQRFYMSDISTDYIQGSMDVFHDNPLNAREYYLLSFFGRANYSFDSRYLFTFTLRGDASSRFSKDNRWGVFPSAAFAWNMKNEKFLKDSRSLSELKLRMGYGSTGQQDIGSDYYSYLARYEVATSPETMYNMGDGFYSPLKPLAYNPNLKWETTDTYNIGLDYGFLDQRIYGSVDLYFRKTKDLLNNIPTSLGTNFSNIVISNIGNMENKGVEFSIGAVPIQTHDLRWNVNFNITWQDTKITKLLAADDDNYFMNSRGIGYGTGGVLQIHKVGDAPDTFYTFQQVYDSNGKPIQNALVDRDKNGIVTENDRYNTGKSPLPSSFFGLSSTLTYKNWDLGFNAHANFGNYVFNSFYSEQSSPEGNYMNLGFLKNMATVVKKSGFRSENTSEQQYSDMFLENASFFKMDDITLGYTFKNVGKSKLNVRTAFSVQNVFTITDYSGLDPEIGEGIDGNIWPRPRTFTFRLNINF